MKTKLKLPDPKKAKRFFSKKMAFTTGPVELNRWIQERQKVHVVDVRRPEDYVKGHIPGAVNVPQQQWHKPATLKKDKANVIYCYSYVCHLAASAALEFADRGYPVMELEGGFETWKEYGLPIQKGKPEKNVLKSPKRVETAAQQVPSTEKVAAA